MCLIDIFCAMLISNTMRQKVSFLIFFQIETGIGEADPGDLLQAAGFHKKLQGNETEAVRAIKHYTLFYRCTASLLQFIEGMLINVFLSVFTSSSFHAVACEITINICLNVGRY